MEDFEEKKQVLSENLEEKVSKIWSETDADVKNMYENSASSFLVGKAKGVITRYYSTNLNSVCATPPPQYFMLPPVTEHVSLLGKSLRRNMARASGGANNTHPLSCVWGRGTNGKDLVFWYHSRLVKTLFALLL